jgi:hypothetical protein
MKVLEMEIKQFIKAIVDSLLAFYSIELSP